MNDALLVQVVIVGQYRENYGAHNWDGEGECPQYWKNKGEATHPFASNVALKDLSQVIAEAKEAIPGLVESNDYFQCWYDDVAVIPNRLSMLDKISFDYDSDEDITSVPLEEVRRFRYAFGEELQPCS